MEHTADARDLLQSKFGNDLYKKPLEHDKFFKQNPQ